MNLDEHLAAEAKQAESYFRAALAREDIGRLQKLRDLLRETSDVQAFAGEALFVGWTPGDLRSKELAPALTPFADALWRAEREGEAVDLLAFWNDFNAERMRILIHCL